MVRVTKSEISHYMFARDNCMNLYPPNTHPSKGLNVNVHKKSEQTNNNSKNNKCTKTKQNTWPGFFLPLPASVVSRPK